MEVVFLIFVGVVVILLFPFAPQVLRWRISVLRWLGLQRLANWHERHFDALVVLARIMIAITAAVLLWIALTM